MSEFEANRGILVVTAASVLLVVLGSVHAFSVFLQPLERQFGVGRGQISLIYSGALICVTLAVLLGHHFYSRISAAFFVSLAALTGAIGAVLAGQANTLWSVWLGYCLLFGTANGLGYGFGLQIVARANPGREGFAMGVATAAYALGAAIAPVFLDHALQTGGFARAMNGLAACLIVTGALSAAGMYRAKARLSLAQADCMAEDLDQVTRRKLWLLWLTYFGGVMAGLMVIGHAAGIAAEANAMSALWLAPAVLAICNLIGSLSGGRVADKHPPRLILILLSSVSVLALVALGFGPGLNGTLVCLGLVGFAYGGTIAAHPAYIAKRFGHRQSAAIYGRIFTAWGAAGLAGPWLAGFLFEASGTYMAAIFIAACFGGVAILSALTFFRQI